MDELLIFGTLFIGVVALVIVWYVLQVLAYWKIFQKAGIEGWKSLIPIYNTYYEYKISWRTDVYWAWLACMVATLILGRFDMGTALAGACQVACFILGIIQSHKLSKAFGHGAGFTVGLVLLNPIFKLILGFGSSQYQGPQE
jgi:hypothetical protein